MRLLVSIPRGRVRDTFLPAETAAALEALGEVRWNPLDRNYTTPELARELAGIDVCLTGWGHPRFDEAALENAGQLRLVAHTGGTVASLVSPALFQRGVRVVSGNDVYARSVAESVVAYALTVLRDIPGYLTGMRDSGWRPDDFQNEGLLDQTVGLVGFGAIARYTVELLRAFGATIKVYSRHLGQREAAELGVASVSLEEVMRTCRVISLHSAATPETYHQIDRELLQMIPQGAVLINTARGSVVDEQALARELAAGQFRAILDVYETEPLPMDSPLRGLPNVYLIPHMGGPTIDQRRRVCERLIADIRACFNGEPLALEITESAALRMTR